MTINLNQKYVVGIGIFAFLMSPPCRKEASEEIITLAKRVATASHTKLFKLSSGLVLSAGVQSIVNKGWVTALIGGGLSTALAISVSRKFEKNFP